MKVRTTGISDMGCVRTNNEDGLLIDESIGFFAVADGMGGKDFGEVASQLALQQVHDFLKGAMAGEPIDGKTPEMQADILRSAILKAGEEILLERERGRKMGTTFTALWLLGDRAIMGHVGDSRLYLSRGGALRQISCDHTVVGEMIRLGKMTQEEAATHLMRNTLTRSMGKKGKCKPETEVLSVRSGDTFVLCSDGLTGHVSDAEIQTRFKSLGQKAAIQSLIDLAKTRGGEDNITVLAVSLQ